MSVVSRQTAVLFALLALGAQGIATCAAKPYGTIRTGENQRSGLATVAEGLLARLPLEAGGELVVAAAPDRRWCLRWSPPPAAGAPTAQDALFCVEPPDAVAMVRNVVLGEFEIDAERRAVLFEYVVNEGFRSASQSRTYLVTCVISGARLVGDCQRRLVADVDIWAERNDDPDLEWVYLVVDSPSADPQPARQSDVRYLVRDHDGDGHRDLVLWTKRCRSVPVGSGADDAEAPPLCQEGLALVDDHLSLSRFDPQALSFRPAETEATLPPVSPRCWSELPASMWTYIPWRSPKPEAGPAELDEAAEGTAPPAAAAPAAADPEACPEVELPNSAAPGADPQAVSAATAARAGAGETG